MSYYARAKLKRAFSLSLLCLAISVAIFFSTSDEVLKNMAVIGAILYSITAICSVVIKIRHRH